MRGKRIHRRFCSLSSVAAIFSIIFLFFASPASHTCSCGASPPPEVALEQAHAVFYGEVIARIPRMFDSRREGYIPAAVFRVKESWKGVDSDFVYIDTSPGGATCGVGFWQGPMYLVYAREQSGRLFADLCSRTRNDVQYVRDDDPFKELEEEMTALGRPELVFEAEEDRPFSDQSSESLFLALVRSVIANGTDLDAAYDKTGVTLLQISAYNNYRQAAIELLKSGASVRSTTESFSFTPLSIAQELNFSELASTLYRRQYGFWLFLYGVLGLLVVVFSLRFLYMLVLLNHSEKEATSNKA